MDTSFLSLPQVQTSPSISEFEGVRGPSRVGQDDQCNVGQGTSAIKTGWPAPELAQDEDRKLFKWFAGRPDARVRVREACAQITEEQREAAILRAISRMNTHIEGLHECDRKAEETGAAIYTLFGKAHATRIEVLSQQISQLMAGRQEDEE